MGAALARTARTPKGEIDKLCFFTSFETRLWPQVGCSIAGATAAVLISDIWLFAVDLGKCPFNVAAIG